MKPTIAIVTALLVEFEAVWSVLEDAEELKIGFSNAKCVVGKIPARGGAQHEVLLVQLRMGMKRNEVTAQELQNQFADIDAVFAVGLGAGISTGESDEAPARLGDIVVCDSEVPIREDREGWRKVVYHKSRPQSERLLIALQERQFAKGQEYFPYDIFDEAKTKLGWDLPDVPADVRIVHGTTGLFRGGVKNPESLRKFDRKIVAVSEGFLGPLSDAEKGYLRVLGICDEAKKKTIGGISTRPLPQLRTHDPSLSSWLSEKQTSEFFWSHTLGTMSSTDVMACFTTCEIFSRQGQLTLPSFSWSVLQELGRRRSPCNMLTCTETNTTLSSGFLPTQA